MTGGTDGRLRWRLTEEDDGSGQGVLFDAEELIDRHIGTGEFRGMEFLHVQARSIINEVPAASRMPFRYSINVYRGCSHACVYCAVGETPVLMADGRTKPLADLEVGEMVYGTVRDGDYRRYVATPVLAHWETVKPAYRVRLEDGTELITSGDHRFLSDRGWKHVTGAEQGLARRPHLTLNNKLIGTGRFSQPPAATSDYRQGYLSGVIRGDGTIGSYQFHRPKGAVSHRHTFRLALTDFEALRRAQLFLAEEGVTTKEFLFSAAASTRREMIGIRTQTETGVSAIRQLVDWSMDPSDDWCKGFLAGVFDAEGSHHGSLRIHNTDDGMLNQIAACLLRLRFSLIVEPPQKNGCVSIRLLGGLRERLRFFHTMDPAITRKRTIDGTALKSNAHLGVVSIEPLGVDLPMYDITTGTGDFIANGVVSHNCFARPTHEYLGLNIGEDFERRIVVKINAVERLQAELKARRWAGHHIAMGTNTDPYQRCEGKYHLTQGAVRVLTDAGNPFSILTKSTLILRDLDLLAEAAQKGLVQTSLSIGTLDEEVWRLTEPGTPQPRRRVEAVRRLNEAGVPCGVLVAPILPGLSDQDSQLEEVVTACIEAGAVSVSTVALHLRPGVKEHFLGWVATARPDLLEAYRQRYSGSYLPKADQRDLADRVRRIADRSRAGKFSGNS
jgi:DNA repair photolyase